MSTEPLLNLIHRAEALLTRLESVLPMPLTAPDWSAAIAFRYRRRGASGTIPKGSSGGLGRPGARLRPRGPQQSFSFSAPA